MSGRIRVVAAVIEQAGRYLLQQRAPEQNYPFAWCSPGGKGEPGESDAEALVREIREECGVTAEIDNLLFEHHDDARAVLFYRASIDAYPNAILSGIGLGWFTPTEIRGLTMTPADHAFRVFFHIRGDHAL